MAETSPRTSDPASTENSVLTRSVIIAGILLAAIFIAVLFLQDNLTGFFGQYADEAVVGLMLLGLWLVASSTVRSINNLAKNAPSWKLILGGTLTAFFAALLTVAFLILFPNVAKSQDMQEVTGATGRLIVPITAIGFVVSLISVINLRVKNRSLGNLLEFFVIGGSILLIVYVATK